jgi:RING-type zinc-finger
LQEEKEVQKEEFERLKKDLKESQSSKARLLQKQKEV